MATSVAFSASWQTKNRSVSGPAAMTSRYVNGTHVHESRLDSSLGMRTVSDLSSRCDMCPQPIRAFCATVPFSNNQVCFAFGAKKRKRKEKTDSRTFLPASFRSANLCGLGRTTIRFAFGTLPRTRDQQRQLPTVRMRWCYQDTAAEWWQ